MGPLHRAAAALLRILVVPAEVGRLISSGRLIVDVDLASGHWHILQ